MEYLIDKGYVYIYLKSMKIYDDALRRQMNSSIFGFEMDGLRVNCGLSTGLTACMHKFIGLKFGCKNLRQGLYEINTIQYVATVTG